MREPLSLVEEIESVLSIDSSAEALAQGYQFISFGSLLFEGVRGLTRELQRLRELAKG